ncbi:hypothetical protein D3C85_1516880 [compost metagenome]
MKAQAQFGFDGVQQPLIETVEAAGALDFRDPQQQRSLFRVDVGGALQRLGDGAGGHLDQLGAAAPGLFQRHAGGNQPFATLVDKAGFLEIVDGAADRRAARGGAEADSADHAGANDAKCGHQSVSSGACLAFTREESDG